MKNGEIPENASEHFPGPQSETAGKYVLIRKPVLQPLRDLTQYLLSTGIDGAIIVTTPQEVSLIDVRKEVSFCKKVGLPLLGVVENMSALSQPLMDVKFMKLLTKAASSMDVTQDVIFCIKENAPELFNVVACSEVFYSSGGGAERMCTEMGVLFLGKVPLEPQLGRAAEQDKFCFENNKCLVSAPALKSIIHRVVPSMMTE